MPTYAEIKAELGEIAKILEKYPSVVQSQVYELLIDSFLEGTAAPASSGKTRSKPTDAKSSKKEGKKTARKKPPRKKSGSRESHSIVKDLNLRGGGKVPSFKTFYEEKKPGSNVEFNALAVYHLSESMKSTGITPNHIYTCYREVKRRPPGAFKQSLWDTSSSRFGYIDASDMTDIKIPHRGISFVEHDLPKETKSAK